MAAGVELSSWREGGWLLFGCGSFRLCEVKMMDARVK